MIDRAAIWERFAGIALQSLVLSYGRLGDDLSANAKDIAAAAASYATAMLKEYESAAASEAKKLAAPPKRKTARKETRP
jgi:hypothetical protein